MNPTDEKQKETSDLAWDNEDGIDDHMHLFRAMNSIKKNIANANITVIIGATEQCTSVLLCPYLPS